MAHILAQPNIEEFKISPYKLIAVIDAYSSEHDFLISVGLHKANILNDLILKEKPKTLVELGGYVGYSAIVWADAMRRASPGEKVRVVSLEMDAGSVEMARKLVDMAGLSEIVEFVVGPAEESLRKLVKSGSLKEVDFIFLDHVEVLYATDLKVCEELGFLKKGVVVVADNVVRPGAPEYREFVRAHPRLTSTGVRALIQPGDFEVCLLLELKAYERANLK